MRKWTVRLGVLCEREQDTTSVTLKSDQSEKIKRGVLSYPAMYDPLGVAWENSFTVTFVTAKSLGRQTPRARAKTLEKMTYHANQKFHGTSSSPPISRNNLAPHMHSFSDATAKGVSAVVYTVVQQSQGVTQQLICAKLQTSQYQDWSWLQVAWQWIQSPTYRQPLVQSTAGFIQPPGLLDQRASGLPPICF